VELHTGAFAECFGEAAGRAEELARLKQGAQLAHQLGLHVNAGHGLNYDNLPTLLEVPHLVELNIGHSIMSRAILSGLESAVRDMLALMTPYSR
jgi:pyridoxine 5-phosphate synthase